MEASGSPSICIIKELKELADETSYSVIKALKEAFATHGIPDVIMGHSIMQRPFDSLQKHTISHMLLGHHVDKKRRHLQRPLDLQVNSSTEWLLTQ